ncbi:MAG: DUF3299 domain-containing protein [Verrucomicrobiaceae bacterium]|nr:DUF3299 domain-containing protein [Verrucomicrobiaceae bacterium]
MKRALFAFIASFSLTQAQEHKLPTESKEAKNAYQQASEPTEAFLADWDFLNKTDVVVSDGEKDATIQYPAEIQALDGKRVAIIGFMAPYEKLDDMSTCMILPASVGCYFCSPPAVTQVALIQQKGGTKDKRPFINEAVIVTGTLRLFTFASQHPAHQADFMYALDDATVEVFTGQNKPRRAPAHLPPDPRKQPKIY